MARSGIKVAEESKKAFQCVFSNSSKETKLPYVVLKFNDDNTEVVIDRDPAFYSQQLRYRDLIGKLPPKSPRYIACDFPHLTKDKALTSTVVLASWFPKDCPVKTRFITGSTFMNLVSVFKVQKYVQGEEACEIGEEAILEKLQCPSVPEDQMEDITGKVVSLNF